ncbi:MAG TPA: cytochrome c biogenesis protein CcdA [Candidatus Baltobacteraceae bacterium]|jgi:cytochrome c-type biogenesis protein|nr:cytochrome c biogenesis protein CcdA [Candidatus Baltobacteraceae bacterium]
MRDPLGGALVSISSGSHYASAFSFAAGVLASVGPCTAPRLIAISAIVSNASGKSAIRMVVSFAAGLVVTYAAFAAVQSLLVRAFAFSGLTYGIIAAVLAAGGFTTLWRDDHACASRVRLPAPNYGAIFLLGCSFALVVSPCCTPAIAAILAYTAAKPIAYGAMLLACFAAGHTIVLFAACAGGSTVAALIRRSGVQEASSVVSGTLMLALAAYYAVLA